jgi:hypothetical protein
VQRKCLTMTRKFLLSVLPMLVVGSSPTLEGIRCANGGAPFECP